ncbi:MAG: bifunctional hydroxymethylpyrimidine kinase/phosphomethylpyrimidine kinase [Thermoplasmata archaeon]
MVLLNFAITIAGSDSISGAGIQEDLKTCTMLGVYCFTVITSITAQNTYEVRDIFDIPENMVGSQIDAVLNDVNVKYGKTGMLSNSKIIKTVSEKIREYGLKLVVDPVMVAKSGAHLVKEDSIKALIDFIIPISYFITPNLDEAEVILNEKIRSVKDMENAALKLYDLGPQVVIIKGGHLNSDFVTDIYYDGKEILKYTFPKIKTKNTHGAGCTLSSAIASYLSKGYSNKTAFSKARNFMQMAIENNIEFGHGHGPLNPMYRIKFH